MAFDRDKIRRAMEELALPFTGDPAVELERFANLVRERRRWAGLTSARAPEDLTELFIDSLHVTRALEPGTRTLVEIGSGGGLLGIPLSVACPDLEMTLVESSSRKAAFLTEAIGALGLRRARVTNARAEELVGSREFDACVSRAAGRLPGMLRTALPLVRHGGRYIAVKQADVSEETRSAKREIASAGGGLTIMGPEETGRPGLSLVVVSKM